MSVQINARISEETARKLDRIAAERGLARPDLLRLTVDEVIAAEAEGRALFAAPAQPSAGEIQHLVTAFRTSQVELGRLLAQVQKQEAKLAQQAREDTLAVSAARQGIARDTESRMAELGASVTTRLEQLAERLAASVSNAPQFAAIDGKLNRVLAHAKEPRTQQVWQWGKRSLSVRRVALGLLAAWPVYVLLFFLAAWVLPQGWLAVRGANWLLDEGDPALCAFLSHRLGRGAGCSIDGVPVEPAGRASLAAPVR